jgi:hypothetical protein
MRTGCKTDGTEKRGLELLKGEEWRLWFCAKYIGSMGKGELSERLVATTNTYVNISDLEERTLC